MMRARLLPFLLMLCCLALPARAEHIVVIGHPDNPLTHLSSQELSDLYLGRPITGSVERPILLDQPRDSLLRARFFRQINGMDLNRVNAYWARLQFSGQMQPPASLPDSRHIIDIVRKNRHAIGYIDESDLASATGVRPLLHLRN